MPHEGGGGVVKMFIISHNYPKCTLGKVLIKMVLFVPIAVFRQRLLNIYVDSNFSHLGFSTPPENGKISSGLKIWQNLADSAVQI